MNNAAACAYILFDTRMDIPPARAGPELLELQRTTAVAHFPAELFMLMRVVTIVRGLLGSMNVDVSAAKVWEPWARYALGLLPDAPEGGKDDDDDALTPPTRLSSEKSSSPTTNGGLTSVRAMIDDGIPSSSRQSFDNPLLRQISADSQYFASLTWSSSRSVSPSPLGPLGNGKGEGARVGKKNDDVLRKISTTPEVFTPMRLGASAVEDTGFRFL